MASTAVTIWQFLASKGLSAPVIAGIMGNLDVESSFDPSNYNAREGAIGIAQWEGGRRTALQQFAATTGGSETNLGTQLNFLWHELTTSYPQVLNQIRGLTDPTQVASIWDQSYEVSAGTTRTARTTDASSIFTAFKSGGVNAIDNVIPASTSSGSGGGVTSGAPQLTDEQYKQALGSLSGLLKTVPELSNLLKQAIAGGWTADNFMQHIQQTKWWDTHNDAARQLIGESLADPAQYGTHVKQARQQVAEMAHQLGVSLNASQVADLASQFMIQGWDQGMLQQVVGQHLNPNGSLAGQSATYSQQLHQVYADYGVPISSQAFGTALRQLTEGLTSIDTFKQQALVAAKSMYPSLASQLDSGVTVRQIADPYMQTMAQMLEIDPNNITLTDPTIKRALQGSVVTQGGKSSATTTTLYDFEKQLRSDPRWSQTQNAKDTISTALVKVGADFGFGPQG